jgi:hypothetical protein
VGVILGVGVDKEPRAKGYLHGQLWNRPPETDAEWILFRLQHYNRFCYPYNFASAVQFIDENIAPAPSYDTDGLAPNLDASLVYAGAAIEGAVYQNSRAYIQRLTLDLEGSPRLYPSDRLSVRWEFKQAADQVLAGEGFFAATLNNSVIGFKLADLISELDGDVECRIAFSSRAYIITQEVPFNQGEGRALVRSGGISFWTWMRPTS